MPSVTRILISYRRNDSADISGRIYDRLVTRFGSNSIFKDVNSIPYGVNFKKYLENIVNQCAVELVIIGRQWLDITNEFGFRRLDDPADFVRIEVEAALRRDIPVIPLLVQGASMPKEKYLPASLAELAFRNGTMVRPDPDFHHDMNRLIVALEKWLTPAPPVAAPSVAVVTVSNAKTSSETQPNAVPLRKSRTKLLSTIETQPNRPEQMHFSKIIQVTGLLSLTSLDWCDIPAGTVTIEERLWRSGVFFRDKVQHVTAFRISKYPVTNAEFQAFVEAKDGYADPRWWCFSPAAQQWHTANPRSQQSYFPGNTYPRESVSWYEAMAFCGWLSYKLGFAVSLPTEQQWQRAAQGDDHRDYPWGNEFDPKRCNVQESAGGKTTPVDQYSRGCSPYQVYDMLGNVRHWCLNAYSERTGNLEGERVLRGTSWNQKVMRLTQRGKLAPGERLNSVGFRLTTELPPAKVAAVRR